MTSDWDFFLSSLQTWYVFSSMSKHAFLFKLHNTNSATLYSTITQKHTHTHTLSERMSSGSKETGERDTHIHRKRGRKMYKLSTLSQKMALKLSRACGSTRDSGKLPFIASQTMGRLTALRMITHTRARTHTHASLTVLCLITQPAAIYIIPPSLPPSHCLLQ